MERIVVGGFWALISSPIWLPILGCWLPMGAARRLRRWLGRIVLGTLVFATFHGSDRDPIQWEAVFISMSCLALYMGGVFLTGVIALRQRASARWRRHTEAEQEGLVVKPEDKPTPCPAAQPAKAQQGGRRIPWDLVVIVVVVCLLTPVSWRGQAHRQEAQYDWCRMNLYGCGKALGIYADRNDGSFPADIDILVQQGLVQPCGFICPASQPAHDYVGPLGYHPVGQPISPGLHELMHSCYVYIPGQKAPADPADVLMYEKKGCHPKNGGNVLFGDYHVEWIEPYSKVEELIAKTEQRLATPTSSPVAAPG